jgi:hypothetical protein
VDRQPGPYVWSASQDREIERTCTRPYTVTACLDPSIHAASVCSNEKSQSGAKRTRTEMSVDDDVEEDTSGAVPAPVRRAVIACPPSNDAPKPFKSDEFLPAKPASAPRAHPASPAALAAPAKQATTPPPPLTPTAVPTSTTSVAAVIPELLLPFDRLEDSNHIWVVKLRDLLAPVQGTAEWAALEAHLRVQIFGAGDMKKRFFAWSTSHQGQESVPLMGVIRFVHAEDVWNSMSLSVEQKTLLGRTFKTLMDRIIAPAMPT